MDGIRGTWLESNRLFQKCGIHLNSIDPPIAFQCFCSSFLLWKHNAILVEAKWFEHSQVPTNHDYIRNGIVNCGVSVVSIHMRM